MKRFYSTSSIFSGPAVKHLFLQYPNINPKLITSTGKNGRITKTDFLSYLEKNPNSGEKEKKNNKINTPLTIKKSNGERYKDLPNTSNLSFKKNEVAHFYVQLECRVDNLKEMKYTKEDIITTMIVKTLQNHPNCNVKKISNNEYQIKKEIDIKFDTKDKQGVLKNAHRFGIEQISNTKLLDNTIQDNGTIIITNQQINMIPILNNSYSMIINFGKEKDKLTLIEKEIKFEKYLTLNISCNQQLIDGIDIGNFCKELKEKLKLISK